MLMDLDLSELVPGRRSCARKGIMCQSSATAHRRSGSNLTAAPMLAKSSVPWQIIIRILCASENDTPHLSYSTLQCFLPHRGGLLADRHGLQMPTQILRQRVQVMLLRTLHGGCYSCHTTTLRRPGRKILQYRPGCLSMHERLSSLAKLC